MDFIRYSPTETSTINTPKSQLYINIPRQDSVLSLLKSYLDSNFEVVKKTESSRYANGNLIRLVNLGSIALFSKFKLPNSSGKQLEDASHAHVVPLMYILLRSAKYSDDLSIGFDKDRGRRRDELALNKNRKVKYHVRIMAKDIFGFVEHQEEATYSLCFKVTITRNKD